MVMEFRQSLIRSAELLLRHMPDPVCVTDTEHRIVWGNEAFRRHPDFRLLADTSSLLQAGHTAVPIEDEAGRLSGYTVTVRDNAPGLSAEDKYKLVAENTSDTIVLVDRQAIVRFVSPSMYSLSGYYVEEYEGMDAFEVLHPDDKEKTRLSFEQALHMKQPVDVEYRLFHADGRMLHIEARVKPVLDPHGDVKYVVAVVRDVTERKNAEQLLENILDNVNAAVWSTDPHFSRYTYCSRSMEGLIGLPRDVIMSHPIRLHDHIHPEDNEALMGEVKARLDRGQPVTKELRLIHVPGETRWARLFVHPYLDHNGSVERLDGIIQDITEKKRSELALEQSEQRYKSLFDNNLDGVFSMELTGLYIVQANRAFEAVVGIPADRLANRCFLGFVHDEDHAAVYETLHRVTQLGEPGDIECRLTDYASGERIVTFTFVPIYVSGRLNGIHGIAKDITKRKQEERELIRSEERHKALQQSLNRLSADLAGVTKVSELEKRLLDEIMNVLPVRSAWIEEGDGEPEPGSVGGSGIRVRIGEKQLPVYLRIEAADGLLPIEKQWLETAVHYVTILYDNLGLLEDLMHRMEHIVARSDTPRWMLRLLFKLSEKERASLSSDLHDSVLQDLIIWYRKLESLRSSSEALDPATTQELARIEDGLLDAIHQIRITCNELRPPFLMKMGLVESLRSLFSYAKMFANYEIDFHAAEMDAALQEEQILGVYRIVQELLNNASKHSQAGKVTIVLDGAGDRIRFMYTDDGVGMDLSALEGSFAHMGMAGIEKRVMSLEGTVTFRSAPGEGLQVRIELPKFMN
ncbi:PAS domain S-box protein [Paenibacillus chartarius]|uniref:histidine kinase n=1 Tax=Paenibacillus chartarius TaxID=747481 RepID=A0ABV6DGQ4_9BACL